MDFGQALDLLLNNTKVAREGWNGQAMWLAYEDTSRWPASKMRPFIYMKAANGDYVPWVASQTDLLAEDWVTVPEREV